MACIPDFIKKFSVVYRPVLVASEFKAEEDSCFFLFFFFFVCVHVHACV